MPINNDLESRVAEAFFVFDLSVNKRIDVREVATVIRGLGCHPTDAEIQEIIIALEKSEAPGTVHLIDFLPYVSQLFTDHKYVYKLFVILEIVCTVG